MHEVSNYIDDKLSDIVDQPEEVEGEKTAAEEEFEKELIIIELILKSWRLLFYSF